MDSQQRLSREIKRKHLQNLLSRSNKPDMLVSMWVLDRAWSDPNFKPPPEYNFPRELFEGDITSKYCVYGWEIETLITELLRYQTRPGRRTTNSRSWEVFSRLINYLRAIEDAEFSIERDNPIEREMTRLAHRQMRWQSNNWQAAQYVRWWSIFFESKLAVAFQRITGISTQDFVRIGVVWNNSLNSKAWSAAPTHKDIEAFLALTSASIESLETESAKAASQSTSTAYRRGVLRQTPIVSVRNKSQMRYVRPIEALLQWRLSSGLYYDVIGDKQVRDANLIGENFEVYIRELWAAKFSTARVSGDLSYKLKGKSRRTPDVLVVSGTVLTGC